MLEILLSIIVVIGMALFFKYGWLKQNSTYNTFPADYPPTALATEVWKWGQANGNYTSAIQADSYIAGSGGTPGHLYAQTGPPGTNMSAVYWQNTASLNSHHTAPGTTTGQSNGPVNANMQPGTSSFKFYFLMKHVDGPDIFYFFFDYDQQQDPSTFNQGMQFFVSTAGLFAPASLIVTLKDNTAQTAEFHAKTGGTTLFEDNAWHLVEMIFDRTQLLPTFKIDGTALTVINTFSGPALSALTSILPTNGIRFGMREFSEIATGRADLMMAAAAYSKNLAYTWS